MKHHSHSYRAALRFVIVMLSVLLPAVFAADGMEKLEKRYALKRDYSFNSITTYSSVTGKVLSELKYPVHAYALFTPGQTDQSLLGLLERYHAAAPAFTYSEESLARNPMLVHFISADLDDDAVTTDCLIIHCPEKGRTRVLSAENFISASYDPEIGHYAITGTTYESSLTEAIVYVTSDNPPSVSVVTGHGEQSRGEVKALTDFLKKKNYAVNEINLEKESPDAGGALMLLSPQKDLTDNELSTLTKYAEEGGALFIATDYSDPEDLPNFSALLRYYGVQIVPGVVVASGEDSASFYQTPLYLMPYMQQGEITTPLLTAGQDRLILAGARALRIVSEPGRDLQAYSLLKSGEAYIRPFMGDKTDLTKGEHDEQGVFDLAVHSNRAAANGNHSQAFIIGNSSVFTSEWLYQNTYSTEFLEAILHTIARDKPADMGISPKAAFRKQMTHTDYTVPALMILFPLLAVPVAAACVLIPRKRS